MREDQAKTLSIAALRDDPQAALELGRRIVATAGVLVSGIPGDRPVAGVGAAGDR